MDHSYVLPNAFELAVNHIVPIPKKAEKREDKELKLTRASRFAVTAPDAAFGPVKTAGERVHSLITDHCGEGCL